MRASRRPPGYLAFVVLGLAGVVGATVATAVATSDEPGSTTPLYVGVGAAGVFMVLLLAYQWIGTAMAARGRPAGADEPSGPGDPPAGLLSALVVDPGAGRPPAEVEREMLRGAVRYQGLVSALALAVVAGGGAYVAGLDATWKPFGASGMGFPLAFAPVFAVLAWGLLTHARRMRWAFEIGDEYLRPLGLRLVAVPQLVVLPGLGDSTRLVGGSVLAGRRHGRQVEIVLSAREHTVAVAGPLPRFTVRGSAGGALDPGPGTPDAVARRLEAITPARRWRGVEVEAGGDALVVRRGGGSDARERWPDDLWLAETCADAAAGGQRSIDR